MKIADLKQPYRRMAEYLAEKNTYTRFKNKEILNDAFDWSLTNVIFWLDIAEGEYPPITEEIKKHFPPDFDFSGEDIKTKPVIQMLDAETQKTIYTELAKEGKFDQLPDTCEFSEPVELEVWDNELMKPIKTNCMGKFMGKYVSQNGILWLYAQLPTTKIDFSEFKAGDVVEVELVHNETRIGWFDFINETHLYIRILQRKGNQICNGGSCAGTKIINKEKIKSIIKIK